MAIKTVERILGAEYLEKVQNFVREYGIPTEKRSDKTIMNAALDICTSERWNRFEWVSRDVFIRTVGLPKK